MLLLSYDTRHIRVMDRNTPVEFSHFQDDLLPLAPTLFAKSASIKITQKQIDHCLSFLQREIYKISISYKNNELTITTPHKQKTLSSAHTKYWENLFIEQTKSFSISNYFGITHQGTFIMEEFLKEFDIPLSPKILHIHYIDEFFFIPFEFVYKYFYVKIFLPSQNNPTPSPIQNISILHDPNLELSIDESLKSFKVLLEKRFFRLVKNNTPDLALISAHGIIDNNISRLENTETQSQTTYLSPKVIVFNSCILAQQPHGVIQHFLDQGTIVIASPFYTLCEKTIFLPLLRFVTDTKSIWIAFCMLRVFYPNIYQYFRIYFPQGLRPVSQSVLSKH